MVAALKEEEAQLTAALARAYASRSAEASELGGAPTMADARPAEADASRSAEASELGGAPMAKLSVDKRAMADARPAQHAEAQHAEHAEHAEADAAQSAQQHAEADALGQQLERVFEKLALCDADGAASRASTILAGLGFPAAMQAQVLYADVC